MERVLRTAGAAGPSKYAVTRDASRNVGARLLHSRPFFPYRVPRFRVQAAASISSNRPSPHLSQLTKPAEKTFSSTAPPLPQVNEVFKLKRGTTIIIGAALVCGAVLAILFKPTNRAGGSVEELVKRGQLRSDRRSNSRPLKYEDPFNNPMVKVGERNAIVKMYGKTYKMQQVNLTEEKMLSHRNRRVQAYQWKRPTVFLVEGEEVPDGVDPDTVRWIPPNHPFATARNDFDEVAAEKNVYQTRGIPSRVRAEHEALRRRMKQVEKETEMQLPAFDPGAKGDKKRFDRSFPTLSEQPESRLGFRAIKPFENPDGEFSSKVQD